MRIAPIKKLLLRQLEPHEVQIVIDVWKAEKRGGKYFAGRLGFDHYCFRYQGRFLRSVTTVSALFPFNST
jgi:hypothetical protein